MTQLWRHATRAGPWLPLALFLALLFAGSSHAWAREPDTREKSPPVLGPPFNAQIARNSLLVVDESDPVAGVSWAGNDVANYVPNAATLRDGTLTASTDTVVTASHLAALFGGQETVRINGDELLIAPGVTIRLPGMQIAIDATRVVIAGALDVSGARAGHITVEADDVEITSTGRIRANGDVGGGNVYIGGEWQGSGNLRAAKRIVMATGSR
ncbi:MAG: hypothetical protein ACKO8V_02595, partial [Actinomycetota bacterium]